MGYGVRSGGIRTFYPDDTEDTFYKTGEWYLSSLLEAAKEKWGDQVTLDDLNISSEYIHTDCLSYDQYDPGDYTNFIVVRYCKYTEEEVEE